MSPEEQTLTEDVAMQLFCVNCGMEQYPGAVADISRGEEGCMFCDFVPPVLTKEQYRDRLAQFRAAQKPQATVRAR